MSKVEVRNKKVRFQYELLEDFNAGIVLTGTEMKSIRNGKASIVESFCVLSEGELFIRNMYIAEYENGSYNNHNPRRDRKLLLTKLELRRLAKKMKDKGVEQIQRESDWLIDGTHKKLRAWSGIKSGQYS